jgi:isochorismate synthase
VAARLTVPAGDGRFRALGERADEALGPADLDPAEEPVPRLYGGFSYDGAGGPLWSGFPGGSFVLPRWELRETGGGAVLLMHRAHPAPTEGLEVPQGRDPDREEDLAEGLRALRARLLDQGRGAAPGARRPPENGATAAPDDGRDRREERKRWLAAVREALGAIRAGTLQKVVLARSLEVPGRVRPLAALARLRSRPTGPGTFLVQPGPDAAFLGSSPELLAELRGTRFAATAVAGSAERGATPGEDRKRARILESSGKDRREQAIVADDFLERLSSLATAVRVSDPSILELPEIFHLESRVEARLPERIHVLEILDRIHPTPAVCGRPRDGATAFLRRHEALERGWYAGPVGWFDLRGDGSFSPALRSGLWTGGAWRLFAGAGIVDGSEPEREWEETELKLNAIRRGFGLPAGP